MPEAGGGLRSISGSGQSDMILRNRRTLVHFVVDALRLAHGLAWQNLRPTTDAATVSQLRDLVHSPSVCCSALERSSDTLPAFALREVTRVLSDKSQSHGETIARVRNVLDEPI